ncbi:hypothetical protein RclHR1_00290012 [Rhizophagus clarus]|uniref:Uncharacterized protein n=1 Tax=Rhizophagus clarus TaxID=94130 RepID=A0A2Z6RG70_9GLOM|nr:hypothetical protein RclHR1_00290012 [Rhizophagus clarus]GET02078.1 hypothetical protein GLOIN_2v1765605 [Rhizophagus clarus]
MEWTQEQIIAAFATWGNPIMISTKKQRKFQTIWVKILLNNEVRAHFDQGLWMYTLLNIWFPEDWSLKERKHRERFYLVWKDCPEAQHTQCLVNRNLQSDFLAKYSIKAYKAIQTPKGERQLIVFFERHTDMMFALRTSFDIENHSYNWSRGDPDRNKIPRNNSTKLSKESSSKMSIRNRSMDQNPTKSQRWNKSKGSADVFNTLADVLKKLASN